MYIKFEAFEKRVWLSCGLRVYTKFEAFEKRVWLSWELLVYLCARAEYLPNGCAHKRCYGGSTSTPLSFPSPRVNTIIIMAVAIALSASVCKGWVIVIITITIMGIYSV